MKIMLSSAVAFAIAAVLFVTVDLDPEPVKAAYPTAVNDQTTD